MRNSADTDENYRHGNANLEATAYRHVIAHEHRHAITNYQLDSNGDASNHSHTIANLNACSNRLRAKSARHFDRSRCDG